MNSIFDQNDNQKLIERINKLTDGSSAIWGKMNVSQMLSHCQAPMDVAFGDLDLKTSFILGILGKMIKNKTIKAPEFKKNSPTAPEFIRNTDFDFETTKKELIGKLSRFSNEGKISIKNYKHPFFGKMNTEEWDMLIWKHLDHHLRQFGV